MGRFAWADLEVASPMGDGTGLRMIGDIKPSRETRRKTDSSDVESDRRQVLNAFSYYHASSFPIQPSLHVRLTQSDALLKFRRHLSSGEPF